MKQYQFSLKDEAMRELPSIEEPIIGRDAGCFKFRSIPWC